MQIERLSGQGLYQKAINVDAAQGKTRDELWGNLGCGVSKSAAFCFAIAPSLPPFLVGTSLALAVVRWRA